MLPRNGLIPFRRTRARQPVKRKRTVPEIHESCYDKELNEEYQKKHKPLPAPSLSVAADIPSPQPQQPLLPPRAVTVPYTRADSSDDEDEICYSDLLDDVELLHQQVKLLKKKVSDSEACCIHQNEVIRTIMLTDKNPVTCDATELAAFNHDTTILKRTLTRKYNSIIQQVNYIPEEDKQKIWLILFDVDTEQEVSSDTKAILNKI